MPVPSRMADLFTLAASNSPSGSDAIGNSLDDYLRAIQAIVRSTNAISSASIASASTTDIGSSDAEYVQITGAAFISSLGTAPAGISRELFFTSSCTLGNSTAIQMAGGNNYTTSAGDVIRFRSLGSGNWKQVTSSPLAYTPVQQGGGAGQTTNKLNIGWSAAAKLKLSVDSIDLGNIALESWAAPVVSPTFQNRIVSTLGALGTTAGNSLGGFSFQATSSNSDQLNSVIYRTAAGSTFSTAAWRIQRVIDGSSQGGLQFGDDAGDNGAAGLRSAGGATFFLSGSTGNCTASGQMFATNFTATSDARLKDDIHAIKPRRLIDISYKAWSWRSNGLHGQGYIAQEVRDVAPEHVWDEKGVLSIDKAGIALEKIAYLEQRLIELGVEL